MTGPTPAEAVRIVRGETDPGPATPTGFTPVYRLTTANHHDVATIAGHPVLDQLAHNGHAPDLIVWGLRHFARTDVRQLAGGVLEFVYAEVFVVHVPDDVPELWPVKEATGDAPGT